MVTDEEVEEARRRQDEEGFVMTPFIEAALNRYFNSLKIPLE